MHQVDIFLAPGFEEIELVTVVDILRRANINTRLIAVADHTAVMGAHQITLEADITLAQADNDTQMLVLPGGGPGTQAMMASVELISRLKAHFAAGRPIAAICAAPMVLAKAGLLRENKATCFPGCEAPLLAAGAIISGGDVIVDGLITTSRGPGTAAAFAFELVRQIKDEAISQALRTEMLFD
ncbi:DJ-1 family glyoxalase III [Iodobacter fluviatilis]|uniref:DJ-1 family protein n=1 Tax=Iodobacter fluviatilis TaxID=537 RepID=A0A7G3G6A9_9NEIS|nr:DJ-1 family glyoxalase III [Iodobacter fluviatilis]QBC42335.1 DJ-1 family protein [Iodobacter fluviatilis]